MMRNLDSVGANLPSAAPHPSLRFSLLSSGSCVESEGPQRLAMNMALPSPGALDEAHRSPALLFSLAL